MTVDSFIAGIAKAEGRNRSSHSPETAVSDVGWGCGTAVRLSTQRHERVSGGRHRSRGPAPFTFHSCRRVESTFNLPSTVMALLRTSRPWRLGGSTPRCLDDFFVSSRLRVCDVAMETVNCELLTVDSFLDSSP